MDDPRDRPSGEPDPTVRDTVARKDTMVGPYRLLERLGEGAMGEVWRAEQHQPIKRIVALKIIKRGMDTREVVTRFEIERQALALMDHPWIAKVYDAGETDGGRPFIAMEYVAGEKLTEYCERNKLSIEARLQLFQKVCQAIHHAHQKAVIHRDLKPTNILVVEVDGEPVPKIIDFGIAKATAQRLTDRSAATFVGQLIGTPLYMSPEQVEMSAGGVDTRADVYSLGVILYELLSGALPHDPNKLANAAFDQVLKVLREEAPERPSTKVSTLGDRTAEVAAQRGLDPKRLSGKLRGDLDWITLKALEKDRRRRYESAKEFADDIARHLRLEAIEARPPSVTYRASRFLRRHVAGTAIVTVALLALIAFALWQTVQSDRIARERDRAVANERLALAREQVSDDPTAAIAYALSSLEVVDQPSAREIVRRALAAGPLRDEWPRYGAPGNPITVDVSADGRVGVVAWSQSRNPTVGVYDVETLEMRLLTAPTEGIVYQVVLNANASHVAAIGYDGIHVWRLADDRHLWHFPDVTSTDGQWHRPADPTKLWVTSAGDDRPVVIHEIDLLEGTLVEVGRTRGRHHADVEYHVMSIDPAGEWVLDYDQERIFLQPMDALDDETAVEVGRHPVDISSVSLDPKSWTAASVDVEGSVRLWDLGNTPPRLMAEHEQEPGTYMMKADPFGCRFFTSWGSDRLRLFEPRAVPRRRPVELLDRTSWTHDGAFLPDRTVVTSANSRTPSRWRLDTPRAWSFDKPDSLGGETFNFSPSRDGRWLYVWARAGQVMKYPLVEREGDEARMLARTPAWNAGSFNNFFLSADEDRIVTYTSYEPSPRVIDLATGVTRLLPESPQEVVLYSVSSSGRTACLMTMTEDGGGIAIDVIDLDSMETRARYITGETIYTSLAFTGDDALVGLTTDHVVRFDLTRSDAAPDTIWTGDGGGRGLVLDEGRSAVVRDSDMQIRWIDLTSGQEIELGVTPREGLACAALHPAGRLLAIGGWWDDIHVYDLDSGEEWRLPAAGSVRPLTYDLAFDPMGRWLLSLHETGLIGWELPLDELFANPSYERLLSRLRSLTNVRVTPDETEPRGFRITNLQDLRLLGASEE